MTYRWPALRRDLSVLSLFGIVTAFYVHPLSTRLSTHLPLDTGDPALNAAVLAWNATTVPLTNAWWNAPWFHPATGATALTENLIGLWPIATPVFWLTGSAVIAYNVTFITSFLLSALAMYFLVQRLTGRADAGIIAGLAFAFAPYRATAELGHLQVLCAYWFPVALGALHGYLDTRRPVWLCVFGIAWVMQSLSNGYYMLFGAVFIAIWLAYFGTTHRTRRAAAYAVGAWVFSSLALIPILAGYRNVHGYYGLRRTFNEAVIFSAQLDSWFQVSAIVRFWSDLLPSGQHPFFPGLTAFLLAVVAIVGGLARVGSGASKPKLRAVLQAVLAIAAIAGFIGLMLYLAKGPWSIHQGGQVYFKMSDPYRALALLVVCTIALLRLAPLRGVIADRSPFFFYVVVGGLMALLACGPILRARDQDLFDPGPYQALMFLPGFDGLRVPSRFWMMGVIALAVVAGLAFARITRPRRVLTYAIGAVAAVGILTDGWLKAMPTKALPGTWTRIRQVDSPLPLLELPIGPGWDSLPTLRSSVHGRRVINGVSGYDPPHYSPMVEGLRAKDPEMLKAMASVGAFDVSIEQEHEHDKQYLRTLPGVTVVADDAERVVFRVPAMPREEVLVGPPLPIASVSSHLTDSSKLVDGRTDTDWGSPQRRKEWILADLGRVQRVGGVSLAIMKHSSGFPRHLVIESSVDGEPFDQVWQGSAAVPAFLAVLRNPTAGWMRIAFVERDARFIRLRQLEAANNPWVVAELEINAPAARTK